MGFGGGGGGTSTEIVQPPNPTNVPLQDNLTSAGLNMLTQSIPYAHAGAGYQLLPRNPFGQVAMAGPNPTIFGDPFNASYAQNFFGPNSGSMPPMPGPQPQQQAMGGGQGGQQGGGSGSSGMGAGAQIHPPPEPPQLQQPMGGQQAQPMGGYNPVMPGQPHPMTQLLQGLLQPGVLGQLFSQYAQSQNRPQQSPVMPPAQPAGGQQPAPQQPQGGSGGNSNQ